MEEILESLRLWREIRGLDKIEFNLDEQVSFILEEVTEYLRAKDEYEKVDALCDICVFSINGHSLIEDDFSELCTLHTNKEYAQIANIIMLIPSMFKPDAMIHPIFQEIIEWSRNILENMGYDFEKCMKETIKEISSRKGAMNSKSGKWEKFKDEESKKLWYKADYSKCKLNA